MCVPLCRYACGLMGCVLQVRERLRSAQERNVILEDELMLTNQEVSNPSHYICGHVCVCLCVREGILY